MRYGVLALLLAAAGGDGEKSSVQDFARVGQSGGKLPPRIQRLISQAAVACADKL